MRIPRVVGPAPDFASLHPGYETRDDHGGGNASSASGSGGVAAFAGLLSGGSTGEAQTQMPDTSPAGAGRGPADLVLRNGKIVTVDAAFTIAQAIAIAGERIVAVGADAEVAAQIGPATRVIDLNGRTVIPGITDGHAHMDREALREVFPSLGRVRSIRDIQARIAELARTRQPGEWIVTMPIGDPPYYFDVPDILAEKRWPTRHELDAAAPNNPVYIRSIWGYWRGTFPLVSCANSEALRRAGITRDTVAPVETLTIEKDRNGDPTGVIVEREMQPIAELIWFRQASAFTHADRLRALPRSARAYHAFGTTSVFEGHGVAAELLRVYKQARRDGALTMRASLAFSPHWKAAGDAPLQSFVEVWAGWLGEAGLGDEWLKMSGLYVHIGRAPADDLRASAAPYTGWAGFNYDHGLPRAQAKELLLHCARNDIRAVMIGSRSLDLYEEIDREIPLNGRRWVISHISTITPREIESIARMGVVLTTHTNNYLYKGSGRTGAAAAAGAPSRDQSAALPAGCRREGVAGDRQRAGVAVPADLAGGGATRLPGRRAGGAGGGALARRRAALRDHQRRLFDVRRGQERLARAGQARRLGGAQRRSAHGGRGRPRREPRADDHGGRANRARDAELVGVIAQRRGQGGLMRAMSSAAAIRAGQADSQDLHPPIDRCDTLT